MRRKSAVNQTQGHHNAMLEIGKFNQLEVTRICAPSPGAYLSSEVGEILLPQKYVPAGLQPGDIVNVFIHLDSEDRLIATTLVPKAVVGQFALLVVKDISGVGAFLDWGLEKDLFVPFGEQPVPMKKGASYLVRLYLDNTGRIAASAKLSKYIETEQIPLRFGEEVELLIWEFTDLGAKVIINDRYAGLLFNNELYDRPEPGSRLKGYVQKIRPDKKIDVTLRRGGETDLEGSKERVLQTLAAAGGFLPLGDKSPPEQIIELLKMSKKTFKKAIGTLYKEAVIELTNEGIKLRSK
jgi:predicted RNA-binding protein (virulence factor B family)